MLSRIQAIFVTFLLFVVCYLVVVAQLISVSTSPGGPTQYLDGELGVKTNDSLSHGGQLMSRALLASNGAPNGSNSGTINTGSLKTSHSSSANDSANAGGQVLKIHKILSSRDTHPLPVPKRSDPLCTEFLSKEDRSRFDSHNAYHLLQNGTCRFMSQSDRAPVALVSHPGSGNTWLRGLLETATGVCTGAVYCDFSLRAKGFTAEFIVSGAVLVVKTHLFPSGRIIRDTVVWRPF